MAKESNVNIFMSSERININLTKPQKYSATKQEIQWVLHMVRSNLHLKPEFTLRGFEKLQQKIK